MGFVHIVSQLHLTARRQFLDGTEKRAASARIAALCNYIRIVLRLWRRFRWPSRLLKN